MTPKMTNEELIKDIDKISNQLKRMTKKLDDIKEFRSMLLINDSPASILYDATINEVDVWIRSLAAYAAAAAADAAADV